jgi:DNA-binding transcriptional MerR regulator
MENTALQIGEIANRSGVSVDTVRYYEKLKILPTAPRTSSGYRMFPSKAVEQIKFIKQAQELGFSLDEIKKLLASGGAEECERVRDLLQTKLAEIDEQIKKMKLFRKTLANHLCVCNAELQEKGAKAQCPVHFEIEK